MTRPHPTLAQTRREPHIGPLRRFAREFTAGVSLEELRRTFDRDAGRAYKVLTRDQPGQDSSGGRARRLVRRSKALFLGLSYKLSPARRVLFACAVVGLLFGMIKFNAVIDTKDVSVDFSPLWFLFGGGLLIFLLALELSDRVLVRDELEVARQLQRDLLPSGTPDLPGWQVAHSYRTANEVGGDYYDFLPIDDRRVAIVIGDASGHGMAAGLLMATASAALKLAVEIDPSPERIALLLNRVLCRTGNRHSFMSLFYGVLDRPSGSLDYICAGHPFPLLRRADGSVVELGQGGLPLGVRADLMPPPSSVALGVGDTLVLYSDGLPEAIDRGADALGYDVIKRLVGAAGAPATVLDRLLVALDTHRQSEPLLDDVCVVVLARL
jgi:hypothetical protein